MKKFLSKLKTPLGITCVILTVFACLFAGAIFFVVEQVKESHSEYDSELLSGLLSEYWSTLFDESKAKHIAAALNKVSEAIDSDNLNDAAKTRATWEEAVGEASAATGPQSLIVGVLLLCEGENEKYLDRWVDLERTEGKALKCFALLKSDQQVILMCRQRLGEALEHQDKFTQALAIFEQNVPLAEHLDKIRKNHDQDIVFDAYYDLAYCYYDQGENDKEFEVYKRFLATFGQRPDTYARRISSAWKIAEKCENGDLDRAKRAWEMALTEDRDNSESHRRYAKFLRVSGLHQQALLQFDKAIKLDPENHLAFNGRAKTYNLLGKYDLAIADLDSAQALNPATSDDRETRADSLVGQKKYVEAIAEYTGVLKLENSAEPLMRRGEVYSKNGQHQEAIDDYTAGLKWCGKWPRPFSMFGPSAHPEYAKRTMQALLLELRAHEYELAKNDVAAEADRKEAVRFDQILNKKVAPDYDPED